MRSYRVLRRADDAHDVQVILDFDDEAAAADFRGRLEQILAHAAVAGSSSSATRGPCCSRWSVGSPGTEAPGI